MTNREFIVNVTIGVLNFGNQDNKMMLDFCLILVRGLAYTVREAHYVEVVGV